MRRKRLERMANSIGRELKKCPLGDYNLGKWTIPNATESGPLYWETLQEVEKWLVKNGAKFTRKNSLRKRRFSFRVSEELAGKIDEKAKNKSSVNDAIVDMISEGGVYEALIMGAWLDAGFDVLDTDNFEPDYCAMLQDLCEAK